MMSLPFDKVIYDEDEDEVLDDVNALMVFDRGEDETQRPQGVFLPYTFFYVCTEDSAYFSSVGWGVLCVYICLLFY